MSEKQEKKLDILNNLIDNYLMRISFGMIDKEEGKIICEALINYRKMLENGEVK